MLPTLTTMLYGYFSLLTWFIQIDFLSNSTGCHKLTLNKSWVAYYKLTIAIVSWVNTLPYHTNKV